MDKEDLDILKKIRQRRMSGRLNDQFIDEQEWLEEIKITKPQETLTERYDRAMKGV